MLFVLFCAFIIFKINSGVASLTEAFTNAEFILISPVTDNCSSTRRMTAEISWPNREGAGHNRIDGFRCDSFLVRVFEGLLMG